MSVPNIMGGIDYGAATDAFFDTSKGLQQMNSNEMVLQQQEKAAVDKQAIQDAAQRYAKGDKSALIDIFKADPSLGVEFQKLESDRLTKVGAEQNQRIRQETATFLQKVKSTPKEQWGELAKEALESDLIDFDGKRAEALAAGNEFVVDAGMINFMGPEAYKQVYAGDSGEGTSAQKDFEYYKGLQERDPEGAKQYGMAKGYVETGRDAMPTTAERDWETYQKLKKSDPVGAKQYGQAAGFITKEGRELSSHMQKRLSDSTDAATTAGANVVRYNDIATQVEKANLKGGWAGQGEEIIKGITGNQDFKSELRKDFYAIRGSEVVNNLPPGSASDVDVAMALSGFPTDNASGGQIASFLKGLAKLNEYQKKYNEFKTNFISENGTERGMLAEWKKTGTKIEPPQRTLGRYTVKEVD